MYGVAILVYQFSIPTWRRNFKYTKNVITGSVLFIFKAYLKWYCVTHFKPVQQGKKASFKLEKGR